MADADQSKPSASMMRKSGIKSFAPGEILFNENDIAESLYIIQRGQIRLFRPKGRGFIEIGILRAGEVIGEMAYFDEKSRKRSCSASAMVTTEVVEVSFNAFEKTMSGLNPWFKTIIITLANRLRKTNEKVKELEGNSVGYGTGGKVADYKFLASADIVKVLTLLYLVMKTHGEIIDSRTSLHMSKLRFYASDIFALQEARFEEFLQLLKSEHVLEVTLDQENLPKVLQVANIETLRNLMLFFNTQRALGDDKRMIISNKCERLLSRIIEQLEAKKAQGEKVVADISSIIAHFKERNIPITEEDLKDAIKSGFAAEVVVGENNQLVSEINYTRLVQFFPAIKLMNAVNRLNESKIQKY